MSKKKNKATKNLSSWWADFKKFISRGNVLDMAVGVVIGGAFSAIVTALVNILLSVCTWGVPGGIAGLITVLPAANEAQAGLDVANGLGQYFAKGDLQTIAQAYAESIYGLGCEDQLVESVKTTILANYKLYGETYAYTQAAVIDWGTFINTIISFLIIAFTLFVILKVYNYVKTKRAEMEAKALEAYYNKHPEERPVVVEQPKSITELDVLKEIKEELVKLKGNGSSEEKSAE